MSVCPVGAEEMAGQDSTDIAVSWPFQHINSFPLNEQKYCQHKHDKVIEKNSCDARPAKY